MYKNKYFSYLQVAAVVLLTSLSVGCCKEEDRFFATTLQVKAFDADKNELGSQVVKDVTLYVFDKEKTFLGTRELKLSESFTLDFPEHDTLKLVVWGNTGQGNQTITPLKAGDRLDDAFVSLIHTKATLPVAGSPDDLFYVSGDLVTGKNTESVLSLRRKTASVAITARCLREYVGSSEGEFRYVLRKTRDKLNFYGKPTGEDVSYGPASTFNDKGDFVSSVFNILPTDEDLKIDIYHRDVLKATVIADSEGKPLRAVEGRLLNVLVDFQGEISVEVKVTDWGQQEIWKQF